MSSEILFLAHRMPFPPDRGDKIRSHHVLKALAEIAPVHVATFADRESDWAYEGELAWVAASHCLAERKKPLPLAGIEGLLRGVAISLCAFRSKKLEDYVSRILDTRPISAIYVFSGQMAQYVPDSFTGRVVTDLVDVDSAKFEAYALQEKWPMSWVDAREGRLLRLEEERICGKADQILLVSEAEAELLRSRVPEHVAGRIKALGNGIDAELFDPRRVVANTSLSRARGPHLVFTGQMDYAPNIEAVQRAARSILPIVRQHHPEAMFHVVGRAPTREVSALDGTGGMRIWGEVPDVKPFLAAADVVAVPLTIARGVQNKVLEAMAMACPVVLTPGAATGIQADDGKHFAIEDNDAAFAARICSLLANRGAAQAMGKAARQFVIDRQSWPAMLAGLSAIMGFEKSAALTRVKNARGKRNAA